MRRTATRIPPTLIAAAGVAILATVAFGVGTKHDPIDSATRAPAQTAVAAPVAIAPAAAVTVTRSPAVPAARPATRVAPGTSGMRIGRDLETGDIIAAGPQSELTDDRSFDGLQTVTLPDGSVMIDLEGRFQEYTILVRDASGKVRARCVHDPARALDPLHVHDVVGTALPSAER